MNEQRNARSGKRARVMTLSIALMFGLLIAPHVGSAGSVQQAQGPRSVTIPAGGSVLLQVRGFCLDFGKPFPTGEMSAKGLADGKIRAALDYAINKGYAENNPQQTELAVWFMRDGIWHAPEHTVGQEIVANAISPPVDAGDGISLSDAITQNKVSVTGKFVPQTKDNFYGDGEAEIKNLTDAELKVFTPIGIVFSSTAGGDFQDLMAYELGTEKVEVQGTPVPLMTVMASPSVTLEPTAHPTLTAITIPETPASVSASPTAQSESDLPGVGVPDNAPVVLISLALIFALALIGVGAALNLKKG
ncbi:MAG TPA: hypothetical protein VJ183_18965 [Chloroflexia bacterium]|nr:hypothetical protein [Chloroflexia bacterium]